MRTFPDFSLFVMSSFRSVVSERRTMNCIWELTYRCNARCSFCSYWEKPAHARGELDLAGIRAGIDNVYRSGCRLINFSGGEPTLRDDLDEIVAHAAKKRIWTSVITNGSLLDRSRIKRLRAAGLDNLFISLDFIDRDAHDRHRHIDGLYDNIMRSVECLRADFMGGHRTAGLMCVVSNGNLDSAAKLAELARRHGIFISFQLYHPRKAEAEQFRVVDVRSIAETLLALKRECGNVISSRSYLRGMQHSYEQHRPCAAGRKYFSVDPMGGLHPCVDLPAVGHVLEHPVSVIRSDEASRHVDGCEGCWYCFRGEADHARSIRGSMEKIAQFGRIILRSS